MMLYFAFASVLLLIPIKDYKRQLSDEYKDSNNKVIDVDSYCLKKPCLVKCCKNDKSLNSKGKCFDTRKSMDGMYVRKHVVQRSTKNGRPGGLEAKDKQLKEQFVFVHSRKFVNTSIDEHWAPEFDILEDGSLQFKYKNGTEHNEVVSPLDFCLDYHVAPLGGKVKITYLFKLAANRKNPKSIGHIAKSKIIAVGLQSIILVQTLLAYVLPKSRTIIMLVKAAFIITLVLAYFFEIILLLSQTTDYISMKDCKLMSPAIYFFTLSNFFWATIMGYDVWSKIRSIIGSRVKAHLSGADCSGGDRSDSASTPFNQNSLPPRRRPVPEENVGVKFLQYCVFAWGVPLLMTMLALAVDLNNIGKIIPIMEPPFKSCFADERQTTLYLYIPITLLTMTTALMIVSSFRAALHMKKRWIEASLKDTSQQNVNNEHVVNNRTALSKSLIIRLRLDITIKVVFIITMMVALQLVSGVPLLINVVLTFYSIVVAATIVSLIFLDRSLLIFPSQKLYKYSRKAVKITKITLPLDVLGWKPKDSLGITDTSITVYIHDDIDEKKEQ